MLVVGNMGNMHWKLEAGLNGCSVGKLKCAPGWAGLGMVVVAFVQGVFHDLCVPSLRPLLTWFLVLNYPRYMQVVLVVNN